MIFVKIYFGVLDYCQFFFFFSEIVFGYKGLKILLYYIVGSLLIMFRVEYVFKVDENFDCVEVRIEINLFLIVF